MGKSGKTTYHTHESREIPIEHEPGNFWLRLDNAAKIYPAIQTTELTSVFRISAVLTDRIKVGPLLKAIKQLESRFPYYKVQLNRGFFWYYLEPYNGPISLIHDNGLPCRTFTKGELIFRVLVKFNTMSVEFSHILTDGTGGFEFLKSLLITYFEACGSIIPDTLEFLRPGQVPSEKEFEDSYNVYFKENIPTPKNIPGAFHLPFRLKAIPRFEVIAAIVPLDSVSKKSKEYKVSITEFLVSAYLYALQDIHQGMRSRKRSKKMLRIEVPINLRRIYPSRTMRNFTIYVMPEIDLQLGYHTFEEIMKTVHHLMQLETDRKLINKIISRNVGAERNVLVKSTPLFIKSLILYFKYRSVGTNLYSGVITNLGKIRFAGEIDHLIDHFVFIPPPPDKKLKVNCGAVGFGNKLTLTFGNITQSKELERRFFRLLVEQAIPVKLIQH